MEEDLRNDALSVHSLGTTFSRLRRTLQHRCSSLNASFLPEADQEDDDDPTSVEDVMMMTPEEQVEQQISEQIAESRNRPFPVNLQEDLASLRKRTARSWGGHPIRICMRACSESKFFHRVFSCPDYLHDPHLVSDTIDVDSMQAYDVSRMQQDVEESELATCREQRSGLPQRVRVKDINFLKTQALAFENDGLVAAAVAGGLNSTAGVAAAAAAAAAATEEVVLTVAIHQPHRSTKVQEFEVLGSTTLQSLRQRIYCLSDTIVEEILPKDLPPRLPGQRTLEQDHTRSSFFYMERGFYVDMVSSPHNVDIALPVSTWLAEGRTLAWGAVKEGEQLPVKRMHECTFSSLEIRLGQPYVFVHRGNCEHRIVFTSMRRYEPGRIDSRIPANYPRPIFQSRFRRRKCRVCDVYYASWVVVNDMQSDETPCFLCHSCFRSLHYAPDGTPLDRDYQVFKYIHE